MSLKAKLEAVIYAAEEPVTLAQLALLFAHEALEYQAEREAAQAATQRAEPSDGAQYPAVELSDSTRELVELLELVGEAAPSAGVEKAEAELASGIESPAYPVASEAVGVQETTVETTQEAASDSDGVTVAEAHHAAGTAVAAVDAELEAKRAERKRDRDVREILRGILDELMAEYASEGRGIEIREIAGGFRMGTKPEIHDAVRSFVKSLKPPMKLSLPALETLAVIAYKQPVTAPEVGEIRGVDSAGVLGSLMSRKLITTAGRKQVIGRPMLYKTTKEFLLRFGLKDVNELPSMEEFEKMAAMELSEPDELEEPLAPVAQSGDLFAQAEADKEDENEERAPEAPEQEAEAVSTPTAETSNEAAAEHAPVERPDAEEVEAEA
jgi:segregation and condensation protein B